MTPPRTEKRARGPKRLLDRYLHSDQPLGTVLAFSINPTSDFDYWSRFRKSEVGDKGQKYFCPEQMATLEEHIAERKKALEEESQSKVEESINNSIVDGL